MLSVLLRRAGNTFCEWPEDQAKKALSRPREQQSSSAIMHTPRDRDVLMETPLTQGRQRSAPSCPRRLLYCLYLCRPTRCATVSSARGRRRTARNTGPLSMKHGFATICCLCLKIMCRRCLVTTLGNHSLHRMTTPRMDTRAERDKLDLRAPTVDH